MSTFFEERFELRDPESIRLASSIAGKATELSSGSYWGTEELQIEDKAAELQAF